MNNKYTKKGVAKDFLRLKEELGHEPSAKEVDACSYLPPARTIQRRWGGLQSLREHLGFQVINHTKGEQRKLKAKEINSRARKYEAKLYNQLHKKWHDISGKTTYVTRQHAYQQWQPEGQYYSNTLSDVALDNRETNHIILIDFFYPADMYSFGGCIRIKRKKVKDFPPAIYDGTFEVLFVCVNTEIDQETIDSQVCTQNQTFVTMSLKTFKKKYMIQ